MNCFELVDYTDSQIFDFYTLFQLKYGLQRNEKEIAIQQERNKKYIKAHKMHIDGVSFADINMAVFDGNKYQFTINICKKVSSEAICYRHGEGKTLLNNYGKE